MQIGYCIFALSHCYISTLSHLHISTLFLPVETHKVDTYQHERNAEPLAHIQAHAVLKGYLILLQEFDEEAESENLRQAETEVKAARVGLGDDLSLA